MVKKSIMENRVYLADCKEYELEQVSAAVGRVIEAFGGAEALLEGSGKGKKVLVKPNLLMPRKPEDATTTHPVVVEAVCKVFVEAGAEVSIIDSTGGPHTKFILRMLYGKTGIKEAAKRSGAKLSFNTGSKKVTYPDGKIMEKSEILSPVLDADLVISLAKAKTHGFMSMTGCVKNLFGCIPGMGKPMLHRKYSKREDFASMLVDICELIKPGLSILDAVYGMEGQGPASGDPRYMGLIAGAVSPYAADLAQCHLMGLRIDSVYTIGEADARELLPKDPELLTWLGQNREQYRKSFKPAVTHKNDAVPAILENCVGCGDCAKICPMKCIKIQNKIAVIDEKPCIRCYCCHEFCPIKAISLE